MKGAAKGENLNQKYGLMTAIAMVVGIVIGSGVFFKAEKVLTATNGNLPIGILAWFLGGIIMVICAYTFAIFATKLEGANGLADYAELALGRRFGYFAGWFMATIYLPTLTSVLAWVSARYFCVLLGFPIDGGECMVFAMVALISAYGVNALSPVLAGKLQISVTVIKVATLFLVAIVGTIVGISTGMTAENFTVTAENAPPGPSGIFSAVCATAFAYDGWIVATSIGSELKNPKKNLPIALIFGSLLVMAAYIAYYIGLAGGVSNEVLMTSGEQGAKLAFTRIFGSPFAGTALFVLVVVSCLGSLNGLMLGSARAMYALAKQNQGPCPRLFATIDERTGMPSNSSVAGLIFSALWLLFFYGANLTHPGWFGYFNFDSSELPVITLYLIYIPIFASVMKKGVGLSSLNRYLVPVLAVLCAFFMIGAAIYSHGVIPYREARIVGEFSCPILFYLIIFFFIMWIGNLFYKNRD